MCKRLISAAFLGLLLLAGGAVVAQEAEPPACDLEGQIVFTRFTNSGQDLFLINADSNDLTQLTGLEAEVMAVHADASWSSDGAMMIFFLDRDHGYNLFMLDLDGNLEQLTNLSSDTAHNTSPSFSPDGTQIVFASETDFANPVLYIMDVDGQHKTALVLSPDLEWFPAWSPDGAWIAYAVNAEDSWNIYRVPAEGGEAELLVEDGVAPAWSPDGAWLAYAAPFGGIFITDLEGNTTQISETGQNPSWSPDGQYLVVGSAGESGGDVWIIAADGSEQCQLTTGVGRDAAPDHSPAWRPEPEENRP